MFRDLPDRFPSVLSRDFRRDQGQYEDPDNLYAMYLLYNLGRYRVRVDEQTLRLELTEPKAPLPYAEAERLAAEAATFDSDRYGSNSNSFRREPGSATTRRRAVPALRQDPEEAPVGDGRRAAIRPMLEVMPQADAELQPLAFRYASICDAV